MATSMASPTATSAAATAIEKNTNTCPEASRCMVEKATSSRLTAFSIISIDMNITMAFLLKSTPNAPMQKSTALRYISCIGPYKGSKQYQAKQSGRTGCGKARE
ncbi:hypothetical protein COLO4_02061 [Corchorus olitorius]|uniref:Uncharacterized protein n=1 Tax=Corchorus olitorius TaxID=93759 RepID=A0A1R3L1Q1_9ROSI|nr:hypothetical protein COLO4_02061 [Corchorus olitorius]